MKPFSSPLIRCLWGLGGGLALFPLRAEAPAALTAEVELLEQNFCNFGSAQEQDAKKLCALPTGEMFCCDYIGFLTALNAEGQPQSFYSLSTKWPIALFESGAISIGPIFNENQLFLLSDNGKVFCLDAFDEANPFRWAAEVLGPCNNEPAFNNQRLFLQDALQNVYAFQRLDGQLIWQRNLLDETPPSGFFTGLKSNGTPFPVGKTYLLALDSEGCLTLLQQDTGERLDKEQIFLSPAYSDPIEAAVSGLAAMQAQGGLITLATTQGVCTIDHRLLGRNQRLNAVKVWENRDKVWFDFLIDGAEMIYSTLDGELVCLTHRTGQERWRLPLTQHPQQILGVPSLTLDEQGEAWVIIPDAYGHIYGVHRESGELCFHYQPPSSYGPLDFLFGESPSQLYEKLFFSEKEPGIFFGLTQQGYLKKWRWRRLSAQPNSELLPEAPPSQPFEGADGD